MNQNTIGIMLEKSRSELKLSQAEFSTSLGISLSTYKRIVNGDTKKIYDALKLALNYRVTTGSSLMEIYGTAPPQHQLLFKLNKLTPKQLDAVENLIDAFLDK